MSFLYPLLDAISHGAEITRLDAISYDAEVHDVLDSFCWADVYVAELGTMIHGAELPSPAGRFSLLLNLYFTENAMLF